MRRDIVRSARGQVVDFDALIASATAPAKRESVKVREVAEKKKKLNGYVVPEAAAEQAPADAAMITTTFKRKTKQPSIEPKDVLS